MRAATPLSGRRGKQLRSAVRTVRERRPTETDWDGNRAVLSMVEEPFEGLDETHRRLDSLQSVFEGRDDRRAVFLTIYTRMRGETARRVDRSEFEDPDWVADYLVAFANLYRQAVREYEAGEHASLPDPWQLAFDAALSQSEVLEAVGPLIAAPADDGSGDDGNETATPTPAGNATATPEGNETG